MRAFYEVQRTLNQDSAWSRIAMPPMEIDAANRHHGGKPMGYDDGRVSLITTQSGVPFQVPDIVITPATPKRGEEGERARAWAAIQVRGNLALRHRYVAKR